MQPAKRCPKCSALSSKDKWLCACGYEFSGEEPEASLTPDEIAQLELAAARTHKRDRILTKIGCWLMVIIGVFFLILAILASMCSFRV